MKYVVINDRMVNVDDIQHAELYASGSMLRLTKNGRKVCVYFGPGDEARRKLEEIIAAKKAATVPEPAQQDSDNDRMKTLERRLANLEAVVERLLNK